MDRRHTVSTLIVIEVQAKINPFLSWYKQILDEWMPAADMSIKEKAIWAFFFEEENVKCNLWNFSGSSL